MSEAELAKQRVLNVYPDAHCYPQDYGSHQRFIVADTQNWDCAHIGKSTSHDAAWIDAASKLPAVSEDQPTQPIPCPACTAPIFVRENGSIVAHYNGDGDRCAASETKMPCDCWKHERQVCDICQKYDPEAKDEVREDNFTKAARFAGISCSQRIQFHLFMLHLLGKGPEPGFLLDTQKDVLKDGPAEGIATCCEHPTNQVFYESGIDDDGCEFENYYCRACKFYLIDPIVLEIRSRSDWETWRTEDDGLDTTKAAEPASPVVEPISEIANEVVLEMIQNLRHNVSQPTPVVVSAEETLILPPMGDKSLHFEDADVLEAVTDTEYSKANIKRHLMHMTCNEKWSMYRAIVNLSTHRAPLPSDDRSKPLVSDDLLAAMSRDGMRYQLAVKELQQWRKWAAALPVGEKESFEEWWDAPEQKDINDDAWASYRNVAERVWQAAKAGEKGEK